MANRKISQLTNSLTKATVDSADLLPVVDTSASETKKMTYQELIQPTDANFRIAGSADNTKLVAFEVDGLTTATTRTVTIPDATTTMVGTDTTQTLSAKTLTAPQINMGSDATGDMYYRTGAGAFARLPIGTSGQIMQTSSGGIPEWVANPAVSDASTTAKGVAEEATLAETLARTAAGGTSARLFVSPTNLTTVQTYDYAASSAGSDTYAITVSPAPTAYVTGQVFHFKADVANTGTATLNVNTLGAKTIVKEVSTTLATGDIAASMICTVVYDGTNMVLQNPVASSAENRHLSNTTPSDTSGYFTYQATPLSISDSATLEWIGWTGAGAFATPPSALDTNGAAGAYMQLQSATTATDHAVSACLPCLSTLATAASFSHIGTKYLYFKTRINFSTSPTGLVTSWGLGDNTSTAFTQNYTASTRGGMRFVYDKATAKMYAVSSKAGVGVTATDVTSSWTTGVWNTLEIAVNSAEHLYYINGVLVATHSTNLETAAVSINIGWGSIHSSGTSNMMIAPITISMPNTGS